MSKQDNEAEKVENTKKETKAASAEQRCRTEASADLPKLGADRKQFVEYLKNGGKSGISNLFGKQELVDVKNNPAAMQSDGTKKVECGAVDGLLVNRHVDTDDTLRNSSDLIPSQNSNDLRNLLDDLSHSGAPVKSVNGINESLEVSTDSAVAASEGAAASSTAAASRSIDSAGTASSDKYSAEQRSVDSGYTSEAADYRAAQSGSAYDQGQAAQAHADKYAAELNAVDKDYECRDANNRAAAARDEANRADSELHYLQQAAVVDNATVKTLAEQNLEEQPTGEQSVVQSVEESNIEQISSTKAGEMNALVDGAFSGNGFAESKSAETMSAETMSAESMSAESKSAESKSAEPMSAESMSAESMSAESMSAESKSAETMSAESMSAESKSAESMSAEPSSAELKSAESISADSQRFSRPDGVSATGKNNNEQFMTNKAVNENSTEHGASTELVAKFNNENIRSDSVADSVADSVEVGNATLQKNVAEDPAVQEASHPRSAPGSESSIAPEWVRFPEQYQKLLTGSLPRTSLPFDRVSTADPHETTLADGTKVAENQFGRFVQAPDGTTTRYWREGATDTMTPDGTVTRRWANGATETLLANGTQISESHDGVQLVKERHGVISAHYPDGSFVVQAPRRIGGTIDTKMLDGTLSRQWTDGSKEILQNDGTRVIENAVEGSRTIKYPDGTETVTFRGAAAETFGLMQTKKMDGTITSFWPDGSKKIEQVDGTTVIEFRDGKKHTKLPDGTVVLEDPPHLGGTKKIARPNGAVTRLWTDGTRVTQMPNGETHFEALDGSTTTTSRNGIAITRKPDGTTVVEHPRRLGGIIDTKMPDGTFVRQYPDGSRETHQPVGIRIVEDRLDGTRTMHYPDGSEAIEFSCGVVASQTRTANGTVTTSFRDGSRCILNADGTLTENKPDGTTTTKHPDGTVVLENSALLGASTDIITPGGTVTRLWPNGSKETQLPNGTRISESPDLTKQIVTPDGTETTSYPDGTTVVLNQFNSGGAVKTKSADGTVIRMWPDGAKETQRSDGSTILENPEDGSRVTYLLNGTKLTEYARDSAAARDFQKPDGTFIRELRNGESYSLNPDGSGTYQNEETDKLLKWGASPHLMQSIRNDSAFFSQSDLAQFSDVVPPTPEWARTFTGITSVQQFTQPATLHSAKQMPGMMEELFLQPSLSHFPDGLSSDQSSAFSNLSGERASSGDSQAFVAPMVSSGQESATDAMGEGNTEIGSDASPTADGKARNTPDWVTEAQSGL